MRTLRRGDSGELVRKLQRLIGATPDGDFGPSTESHVEGLQQRCGLHVDGVAGDNTWGAALFEGDQRRILDEVFDRLPVVRVDLPGAARLGGYPHVRLRHDVAAVETEVVRELVARGGASTSSGGLRGLSARRSPNRAMFSLHHLGRAKDQFVGAAMSDPDRDPFVVARDGDDRYWRVYARVLDGEQMTLLAEVNNRRRPEREVSGRFLDLTALYARHGFERIRARRAFWERRPGARLGGAEWWHFQYEVGLVAGETTYGEELLRVWRLGELQRTVPWRGRARVFGRDWA